MFKFVFNGLGSYHAFVTPPVTLFSRRKLVNRVQHVKLYGMIQKPDIKPSKLNPATLTLIAILLAFVAVLVFIWLWYDLKNHSLEKQKPTTVQTSR
jgi:hypothetical protein